MMTQCGDCAGQPFLVVTKKEVGKGQKLFCVENARIQRALPDQRLAICRLRSARSQIAATIVLIAERFLRRRLP